MALLGVHWPPQLRKAARDQLDQFWKGGLLRGPWPPKGSTVPQSTDTVQDRPEALCCEFRGYASHCAHRKGSIAPLGVHWPPPPQLRKAAREQLDRFWKGGLLRSPWPPKRSTVLQSSNTVQATNLRLYVANFEGARLIALLEVETVVQLVGSDGEVVLVPGDARRRLAADRALEADRFAQFGHLVVRHRVELGRHGARASARRRCRQSLRAGAPWKKEIKIHLENDAKSLKVATDPSFHPVKRWNDFLVDNTSQKVRFRNAGSALGRISKNNMPLKTLLPSIRWLWNIKSEIWLTWWKKTCSSGKMVFQFFNDWREMGGNTNAWNLQFYLTQSS